ncbi:MAG: hypothetical protein AAGJ87_11840 [Pseudomonadota bacterium]
MRIVLKVLRWAFSLLIVMILFAAVWPWKVVFDEQQNAAPFKVYLQENVQRLRLDQPDPGFDFPNDFYTQKLFLIGEIHGAQTAQHFDLALMKHLNERIGVRWLMAELSYVQAARFNAYLETGDEAYLTPVFEAWLNRSAQWGNRQHYDKIKALRVYNLGLPEDRRIRYFGVDLIHADDREDAASWLNMMLSAIPAEAPTALTSLRAATSPFDQNAFSGIATAALDVLNGADATDLEALGVDTVAVAHLVRNIQYSLNETRRYEAIPANIAAMVNTFGVGDDEPLYGFWGLFHVMKAIINDTGRPLAVRLAQSDLPFADDIVSVSMIYADSKQNMPSHILPGFLQSDGPYTEVPIGQNNPYLMYLYGIGDLRSVANGAEVSVFRLYEDGSPYIDETRLRTQTGILTKAFKFEITPPSQQPADYVVLIDGSPALTAWQGDAP